MEKLIAAIPFWGAGKKGLKVSIGNFSATVSGGGSKFLRSYRLLWVISKKSLSSGDTVMVSMKEGKAVCGGLKEFKDTVKAIASVRIELSDTASSNKRTFWFSPFLSVEMFDDGFLIKIDSRYASHRKRMLNVFSLAGSSEKNIVATRIQHILSALLESGMRNISLTELLRLVSGLEDKDVQNILPVVASEYFVSNENPTVVDMKATLDCMAKNEIKIPEERHFSEEDISENLMSDIKKEDSQEDKSEKRSIREAVFEAYANTVGIKKEAWTTAYKRFAKPLVSISDEVHSGSYTLEHVLNSISAWNQTGLSWTLETVYKSISYPVEKIQSFGGKKGTRSGATEYSDTGDRSYMDGI